MSATPLTPFRLPPAVKAAAAARAAAEGRTLTDVVIEHLAAYGEGKTIRYRKTSTGLKP